jgi:hypothetical protein
MVNICMEAASKGGTMLSSAALTLSSRGINPKVSACIDNDPITSV